MPIIIIPHLYQAKCDIKDCTNTLGNYPASEIKQVLDNCGWRVIEITATTDLILCMSHNAIITNTIRRELDKI